MGKTINLVTFIAGDGADYAEFLRETCEAMKSGSNEINYMYVESVGMTRHPEGYVKIAETGDAGHNSLNHGIALNKAFECVTGDYNVFCDADVAITYKGWDQVITDRLDDVQCFGFDEAGTRYSNFPSVFFFAFNKNSMSDIELDFRPKISDDGERPFRYTVEDPEEAKWLGKKSGDMVKCDTGWKLPLIVHGCGYRSEAIKRVLGNESSSLLPFSSHKQKRFCLQKPSHMSEWHYGGRLFGTHKQASRNHPIGGDWGGNWVSRVKLYLSQAYDINLTGDE